MCQCELAVDAVHKVSDGGGGSQPSAPRIEDVTDTMIFSPADLVTMTCRDVDLTFAVRGKRAPPTFRLELHLFSLKKQKSGLRVSSRSQGRVGGLMGNITCASNKYSKLDNVMISGALTGLCVGCCRDEGSEVVGPKPDFFFFFCLQTRSRTRPSARHG